MLSMNALKPSTVPTFSPSHHHLRSKQFKPASLLSLPPPKLPSPPHSSSSSSSVRSWIRTNSTFTNRKNQRSMHSSPAEAAAPAVVSVPEQDSSSTTPPSGKQKHRVAVKAAEKARIALKFIWMEKNIGVAVDQEIPGHGTIPLSPYYFWPRKDAWDELKVLLESKPWISNKQMVLLLNQATDIINLWQQSGSQLS